MAIGAIEMTGKQELLRAVVNRVALRNYEYYRLQQGDPTEATQKLIERIRSATSPDANIKLPHYDENNIYGDMYTNSLLALIEGQLSELSYKAKNYYMNASDMAFERFCKEVLKLAGKKVDAQIDNYEFLAHKTQKEQS
jgi:hypothetical protein